MNLPNKLTLARVFMIPIFVLAMHGPDFGWYGLETARFIGTGIFIFAALTDWLDGWLARKLALVTDFGRLIDPLADKVLVMAAMVYLVVLGDISPWILILIESREFVISGIRMVAANKGKVIAAGVWGKAKTVVQMIMIPTVLIGLDWPVVRIVAPVLIYGAVALSVISAVAYIWSNRKIFDGGIK